MLLRPFLNDTTSCASYLFGCTSARQAGSRRPARRPRRRLPRAQPRRSAPRSWRSSRRTCRPTTSRACRRWSSARARPAYLPAGAGVEFEHVALADGDVVELGNTLVTAIATPGHAPAHHAYAVADRRRGTRGALARLQRRLALDRRRRPARPARRVATRAARRACCTRACGGCSSCQTTSSSTRATTAARSADAASPATRSPRSVSSAPTTRCSRSSDADAFADALVAERRHRPPDRNGSSPPTAPARARSPRDRRSQLGLRANARQFALLVGLNALVGAMVGLERSVLPLVGEQDFGLTLERGDPRLRRRLRRRQGARPTSPPAAGRAGRAQAPARARLAARAAGAAPDRPRPLLVVHRRREPAARRQPGARLVDDRRDEDRPGRAAAARSGARAERGGRLPRRRRRRLRHRRARRRPRAADGRLGRGGADRVARPARQSRFAVRDTAAHVALRAARARTRQPRTTPPGAFRTRHARPGPARLQPGRPRQQPQRRARVGSRPALPAANGASVREIGVVAAVYPLVWGAGQLADRLALRPHRPQAPDRRAGCSSRRARSGCSSPAAARSLPSLAAAALLGAGTAMVYPTLIAAVSDAVQPRDRAPAVGVYRFWRDFGFVAGALISGLVADTLGAGEAITFVAALTAASGAWVAATAWPSIRDSSSGRTTALTS